jgi:probable rRNA maturation factor
LAHEPEQFDIAVEIDPPYAAEVAADDIIAVTVQALRHEGAAPPLEVGVWITNESEIRTLNWTYRGMDSTTDVLSFGAEAGERSVVQAPGAVRHLGDLAISYPHVVRQAEDYGHSRARELAYLVVHGTLHLLGYDHERAEDAAVMRAQEEAVLGGLGITRGDGLRSDPAGS